MMASPRRHHRAAAAAAVAAALCSLLLLALLATPAVGFRLPARPVGLGAPCRRSSGSLSRAAGTTATPLPCLPPSLQQHGTRLASSASASASMGGEAAAPAAASSSSQAQAKAAVAAVSGPLGFLRVLWRFTRPHTFIGTALCIPALTLYAAPAGAALLTPKVLGSILWALLPAGLINVYITGLNQVTDVEIDKINKPYLPIAAGQLSKLAASVVVVASLVAGLGLGLLPSPFGSQALLWVLLCSVALGTSYSLPPLRLKRYPVLAALCIIAVRGTVINMGFYGHALHAAFGQPEVAGSVGKALLGPLLRDAKCMAATLFFAVFGAVIALMKDVPDIKGDELNNIKSFSVRAGAPRIFKLGKRLMISLFLGAAGLCLTAAHHALAAAGGWAALTSQPLSPPALAPFFPAFARTAIAGLALVSAREVQARAGAVDPLDGKQVYGYYMFLWKLFYFSYLALPLAR